MSIFGSTKNVAPPTPRLLGVQTERVNTNEAARPLTWFAGRRWMGVTWLGDAFGVRTVEVTARVGKKSTTIGHDYYASIVGLACCGPVDRLLSVKFDDELVWEGDIRREDADWAEITIESRGLFRIYWGTESQTLDSLLSGSGIDHNAYRGQCYVIGEDILFGRDRTNAPNIQLELVRLPRPTWLAAGYVDVSNDANPAAVLAEWWTDARYGMGRPESTLDTARLAAAAATLHGEGIGVSPLITTETDFRTALTRLLEHVHGYPTTYNGKLGLELVRATGGTPVALAKHDLLDDPDVNAQSWSDTFDETRVRYPDRVVNGQDNSVKHSDRANFATTGRHRPQNLDRPWCTRYAMAHKLATAEGLVAGVPRLTGRLRVRADSVASLAVGGVFTLQTRDGETLQLRCTERTDPSPGRADVRIAFESDTGWATDSFDDADQEQPEIPATPSTDLEIPLWLVLDCPYAFAVQPTGTLHGRPNPLLPQLLFAVARQDSVATEYEVLKSTDYAGVLSSSHTTQTGGELLNHFWVKCELSTEYDEDTLPIDDVVGISFSVTSADQTLFDGEWDYADALNHELLAFFGSAANEIMSLYNVTRTGANTFTADVVRGLYDTRRRTHAAGTQMWLILRPDLDPLAWPPVSESARYYRVSPYFGAYNIPFADITPTAHTENKRTVLPLSPGNLAVNGDLRNGLWTSGSDVTVTWNASARARTIFGLALEDATPSDLTDTWLQIWSYDGATMHYETKLLGTTWDETVPLTNAQLVSWVNDDFQVRLYGMRNGLRSIDYAVNYVRKI